MLRSFFLIFLFSCSTIFSATPAVLSNKEVVEYAQKHISPCGILDQTTEGLVYLKVSDEYINALFPLLQKSIPTIKKPPYFGRGEIGAHITEILPEETASKKPFHLKEKGEKICFTLAGLYMVEPVKGPFKKVYYLKVISTYLEHIRESYQLPPHYQAQDFHITIAVEYPTLPK